MLSKFLMIFLWLFYKFWIFIQFFSNVIHVSEYASVKFVEEMISNMKEKYIFTLSEPEDNKDINQNNWNQSKNWLCKCFWRTHIMY